MKVFLKDFETGEYGEYYITGDMNYRDYDHGSITFEVDAEEVYPEMVTKCDISVTTKVGVNDGSYLFEDELLDKIVKDIEDRVNAIEDVSEHLDNQDNPTSKAMLDSCVHNIKEHIKKFREVLDIIYDS